MYVVQRWGVTILVCSLLAAVPLWAESHDTQESRQNIDTVFLKSAGQSTLAALQFSSAVKDRTPKVTVRAYSESAIAENHRIRQRLVHWASRKGVTIPVRLNSKDSAVKEHLDRTAVTQLDERYAHVMVRQEQQTIAQFRQEALDGTDPLLRDFARTILPTLQGLLNQAQEIGDAAQR